MSVDIKSILHQSGYVIERYQVSWGGMTEIVAARDETTAWARFCDKLAVGCPELARNPKAHARSFVKLDDVPSTPGIGWELDGTTYLHD
jgi:hypothetical protein